MCGTLAPSPWRFRSRRHSRFRAGQKLTVQTGEAPGAPARAFQPHVVILDFLMPQAHGGDVAWQFWSDPQLRNVKVVLCSGAVKAEIANRLPPCTIPILEKPVDPDALVALLTEWARTAEAHA